jgi:hypothetical protein
MSIGGPDRPRDRALGDWLRESAAELSGLIAGDQADQEGVFQDWLERHPAFVPGARGPGGNSGHTPWPCGLISQPRLEGIVGKQPDFCWIASDSAEVTAMLIEIETPAKRWQRDGEAVQSAELTEPVEQLNAWRAWFSAPDNQAGFLREYLVPDYMARRHFTQHYLLIHGSRSEFEGNIVREAQRAASIRGTDYQRMSFDRLPEIVDSWSADLGCVRRREAGYQSIAVPSVFSPTSITDSALALTGGLEDAVAASPMDKDRREEILAELRERATAPTGPARFRPRRSGG